MEYNVPIKFHWTENRSEDKEFKLDSFNRFNEFGRNLNRLKGEVPFSELFPSGFMAKYTNFTSFDDLLAKCGFKVETVEDFANIPDAPWNTFIASTTRFAHWDE